MERQRSVLEQDASQGSTGAWVHRLALQQGQHSADNAPPQSAEHALHRRAMLLRLPTGAGQFLGECTGVGPGSHVKVTPRCAAPAAAPLSRLKGLAT